MTATPEQIADDTVWKAHDALVEEADRWRLLDFRGQEFVCVRDRLTTQELLSEPGLTSDVAIEHHRFGDRKTAESFIQWRATKAALEAVAAIIRSENDA